ncbi:TPA: phage tail tape measure protein [Escherichia coli]|nr:phage tail tape measure protein [Escherichia coli]
MTDNFYAPPHSIEAEQAVIGGLLLDDDSSERVRKVLAMLKPDSFYSRPHKILFEEITRMHREQKPVDGLTLFDELERKSLTASVGGFAYIAEIAKNTPSAANIVAYAMQVRETAMERYAINRMAANDIAKLVAAGGQAGIAREDLKQFAEDALKMGVAFDQSADQSGEMMAKWRTSFKMTQGEVVSLADKINYLSNNGAASAQQISDIVTRIGPLGEVAGIASGQIAALGATLAGVGVEQEIAATGIKNFMLAITGGSKQQQEAFQFLGFNSKKLASDMQKDAQGTMLKVLESISKLDKARQPKALNVLFGKESIGAIAPLLTNLDLLKKNFNMVGDASQYTGSMQKEYEARAATTANQLQLLRNQATHAGVALGNALLPQINASAAGLMPLIQKATDFVSRNPT